MSARKVDPWKRPGLGPWLNDAGKRAQWDGLIFSRQDRIARSSLDWHKLVKWLTEYDKTMICLDPMADLTTASGRFVGVRGPPRGQRLHRAEDPRGDSRRHAGAGIAGCGRQ